MMCGRRRCWGLIVWAEVGREGQPWLTVCVAFTPVRCGGRVPFRSIESGLKSN